MSQVLQFHDWSRGGPLAWRPQLHRSVVPDEYRIIDAGSVHMINMTPPASAIVDPAVPEYAVHLVLQTPPLIQVGFNRPPRWLAMSPGAILAAPPDTAGDFIADGPSHILSIVIPKAHVEDFTRDSGAHVAIRQEQPFREPHLAHQLIRLWHTLTDEAPSSRLFADHVMREVIQALARRTQAYIPVRYARERLAAYTLRRLRDYVESSLADDLDVKMMADVAALSPAHFARAFAATVGMTPFQYVMTRRLARAHELLEHTNRSTLDIALAVGFKTPSHFASRFHREFGLTPRQIRPDARQRDEPLVLDFVNPAHRATTTTPATVPTAP